MKNLSKIELIAINGGGDNESSESDDKTLSYYVGYAIGYVVGAITSVPVGSSPYSISF